MATVGEADPTFSHLQEALKKAKAQCQVRPVEDRVVATKDFIERAKKRPSRSQSSAGGSCRGPVEIAPGGARFERRGARVEEVPRDTCRFCQRAYRIAHVSLRVAAREYRAPFAVVVQPKWRRTRTQTAKKFGEFHSRFGTVEPGSRAHSSGNRPKHADVASRFFIQRDPDRQCRSQSTFESVQPPLKLTGDLTIRVPGRDGLKGVRVSEASNPGPPRLLPRTSVAPTQADNVDDELMTQLEADLSGENRRPKVHVLSEGSSGSDTESRPTGQVIRGTRRSGMHRCTKKPVLLTRSSAIWHAGWGQSHGRTIAACSPAPTLVPR